MNVLVLGAAVSGRAAVALATRLGYSVAVYDRSSSHADGVVADRVSSGPWNDSLLSGIDVVVTSPGIPERSETVQSVVASGIPLWSEMEFAARHLAVPYGAVTGTNGKTTVTQAAAEMLSASGMRAMAAGNIGTALSGVVGESADAIVVEASSFQLRFTDSFHPTAAVLLNIAPDHLDWHAGMADYTAAKLRIAENQGRGDVLAYDADDRGASEAIAALPLVDGRELVAVSGVARPAGGAGPEEGAMVVAGARHPMPDGDAIHVVDMAAAAVIARHMGATSEGIEKVLESFAPPRHRRSLVGVRRGVAWVNDSKATNPHAAVAAASTYPSVILIAGGRNKGLDLSPLAGVESIRFVLGIGEAASELREIVPAERYRDAGDLVAAVALADELAREGDTVLLAPGCASFDQFASYGERGDIFTRLVLELEEANRG